MLFCGVRNLLIIGVQTIKAAQKRVKNTKNHQFTAF